MKTQNNKIHLIEQKDFTLESLFQAYYDCRKHKRSTMQSIDFEFELEKNIYELYEEILNDTYEIGKSICFIVTEPKPREVWAGAFRDRIVHHLIYTAIKDRFICRFIKDTYSCIPGRGTLRGSLQARNYARKVSRNYSRKAYFLKADIGNFFNSIDKQILYDEIAKYVFEPWLLKLIEKVLFHDPKNNVYMKSPKWLYNVLPKYKSLFNTDSKKGLPIGNLTSQFFSNVYLNPLDQFVKHQLHCKYYCRYVDDMILMHKDAGYLNEAYARINDFLKNNLALSLNHKKKNLNSIYRGFDFVGHVIKPNRIHPRQRTVKKSISAIKKWKSSLNRFSGEELTTFRNKINSYLGMYRHVNAYGLRKRLCFDSMTLFTYPSEDYSKLFLADFISL